MGNDDLNKTEIPEGTRGDVKDQFSQRDGWKLGDAVQAAHDRDVRAEERIRRLEREARELDQ